MTDTGQAQGLCQQLSNFMVPKTRQGWLSGFLIRPLMGHGIKRAKRSKDEVDITGFPFFERNHSISYSLFFPLLFVKR